MTYTHGPDPYTPIMPPSLPTLRIRGSSRNAPLSVMSPPKSSNLSQLACRQITNPKLLYALLPIPATRHHHFPSLFPVLMPIQPIHTISLLLTTFYQCDLGAQNILTQTRTKKLRSSLRGAKVLPTSRIPKIVPMLLHSSSRTLIKIAQAPMLPPSFHA